jgi:hypothetical protein
MFRHRPVAGLRGIRLQRKVIRFTERQGFHKKEENMKKMKWMGLAIMMGLAAGCSTTGYQKAGRGSDSMAVCQGEIQSAREQVSRTITSLDSLINAQVGDLRPLFADFNTQVTQLEKDKEAAASRVIQMQADNKAYFASWAQDVAAISDPTMKAQSQQRLEETYKNYQQVEKSLLKVRDAYLPMSSKLKDFQVALNQDLSPSGVAGLKPSYAKVRQEAITLQGTMREALSQIQAARQKMTYRASGIVQ